MTRHRPFIRIILVSFALASALVVTGCEILFPKNDDSGGSSNPAVTKVSFSGLTSTVTLTGLSNSSVYLVKLNTSPYVVSSGNSGSAANIVGTNQNSITAVDSSLALCDSSGNPVSGVFNTSSGRVVRYDHKASTDFSAHPPISPSSVLALRTANARSASTLATAETYSVGQTKTVWVEGTGASGDVSYSGYYWRQLTVTLRAISTYASVWVAIDYDAEAPSSSTSADAITATLAQSIADTFTKIYPVETSVLGYEYGGGPNGSGGVDAKKPVDIILYDIGFNTASDPVTNGGVVGYFWGKDWYPTSSYTYSNQGEIFYIDTLFAKKASGVMYSTLAHEFQHMINWNVKTVTNGVSPSTWYNEMLSQVAEDMMSSYLTANASGYAVSTDGPIAARIPTFNAGYYLSGVTDFYDSKDPKVYYSYAGSYAFGAYLARNYGGAALINAIESNNSIDANSITAALTSLNCSEKTFAAAFARYPEALICSSSGNTASTLALSNTFDRTDTHTVNSYSYTFPAFDIAKYSFAYTDANGNTQTYTGPSVYSLATSTAIRPYGCFIQSSNSWLNVSGNLTVTLVRPADSNISMYLVVRGK